MAALGLLGGAAAFAFAAERRPSLLVLDLATQPPAAPAIAAIAEAAPEVVAAEPVLPQPAEPTDPTPVLSEVAAPSVPAVATSPTLPEPDIPIASDLHRGTTERAPSEKVEATPRPKPRPEKPLAKTNPDPEQVDPPSKKMALAENPPSAASAPSSGAKAKGGELSPAAYAKAVLKKVRATRKKSGAGKGTVVVGFAIDPSGGLASVQVLKSSGSATLDAVALDHIRRSAPFPVPPAGAKGGYSFEFVGK
jgi:periplasmic protein TonB